jgi:hypothetical protein
LRLQLSRAHRRTAARSFAFALTLALSRRAEAQIVNFETTHALYHESPTRTSMTVYSPGAELRASPWTWLNVGASYEADIVSGASVSTKAGPAYQRTNPGADVVSTASVKDLRHRGLWSLGLTKGDVQFTGAFAYSTENDYKSRALNLGIRTDAYEHNTQFELGYSRAFDLVCDRTQSTSDGFARFRALEDSSGCFTETLGRRTRDLAVDGFQGSWSQSWTPRFVTQLVYTAQIVNGFQSNPYRSIILGQGVKAQEHHPEDRARHAISFRANYFLKPAKLVFRFGARGYIDSWSVKSITGEIEAERYLTERLRVGLRGRYYQQSGAVFFSDDYTGGDLPLGPKGQYFTGDRELSPFFSLSVGARINYAVVAENTRLLGFLQSVRVGAGFDTVMFNYTEFTLGGAEIGNARAYLGTAHLSLGF